MVGAQGVGGVGGGRGPVVGWVGGGRGPSGWVGRGWWVPRGGWVDVPRGGWGGGMSLGGPVG